MKTLIEKLIDTQKYAMSIRPQVGGFPVLAQVLRQNGIKMNRWYLPSCQSIYIMKDGCVVQQGVPLISGTHEIPKFDQNALINAIRTDQSGKSNFPEFLMATWKAGVVSYDVDFTKRLVTYFGVNGESYFEEYPEVEVRPD